MTDTNQQRADRAEAVLKAYVTDHLGEAFERSSTEITDLITDLLHLAERIDEGDNPVARTLRVAHMHYEAEYAQGRGS